MSEYILFKFETDEDSKNRDIKVKKDSTIREGLLDFLRATNSVMTLDLDKIVFWNKSKMLNSPKFLDKKVGQHFNSSVQNVKIKVNDTGNILGGRKIIIF